MTIKELINAIGNLSLKKIAIVVAVVVVFVFVLGFVPLVPKKCSGDLSALDGDRRCVNGEMTCRQCQSGKHKNGDTCVFCRGNYKRECFSCNGTGVGKRITVWKYLNQ